MKSVFLYRRSDFGHRPRVLKNVIYVVEARRAVNVLYSRATQRIVVDACLPVSPELRVM